MVNIFYNICYFFDIILLESVVVMSKKAFVIDEEYRMKVVNFLKIYGYYNGILSNIEIQKKYISGELKLIDIIQSKKDFKELKYSINEVLEYCYKNYFKEIEDIMNNFYNVECLEVRRKYGSIFDRF